MIDRFTKFDKCFSAASSENLMDMVAKWCDIQYPVTGIIFNEGGLHGSDRLLAQNPSRVQAIG